MKEGRQGTAEALGAPAPRDASAGAGGDSAPRSAPSRVSADPREGALRLGFFEARPAG